MEAPEAKWTMEEMGFPTLHLHPLTTSFQAGLGWGETCQCASLVHSKCSVDYRKHYLNLLHFKVNTLVFWEMSRESIESDTEFQLLWLTTAWYSCAERWRLGSRSSSSRPEVYRSIYTRGPQGHSNPTMRQSASAFQVHIIVMSGYYIVILVK